MKKIKSIIGIFAVALLIIFLPSEFVKAQALSLPWAVSAGGSNFDIANSTAIDIAGNVFVTGYFESSTISFDTITLFNTGLSGSADLYIAKYDSIGNVIWAKSVGGYASDISNSVTVDYMGCIVITGIFDSPTITFGSKTLNNVGDKDIFIAKYSTDGVLLWAKSEGGSYQDQATSVIADATGNIIVVGYFDSPVLNVGTTPLTNTGIPGYTDLFIAKYDSTGSELWSKSAGGIYTDKANGVAIDFYGSIIVAGYFESPSITFGTSILNNNGNFGDVFFVKYDTAGVIIWAKSEGGNGHDLASALAIDPLGNIIITGHFTSNAMIFGSYTLYNFAGNNNNVWIAKYDSVGNVLWAKSSGDFGFDESYSIAVDLLGNVIIVGGFSSTTIQFGSIVLTNAGSFVSVASKDIFIVKFDSAGQVLWAKAMGGIYFDQANSVKADNARNLVVAGGFESSAITFGLTTLTNSGFLDIYITKLNVAAGINEMEFEPTFYLYPNPCVLNTSIVFQSIQKDVEIKIIDMFGNIIKSQKFTGTRLTLQKDEMKPGIYVVQVTDDKAKIINKKMLVQ
nr:T9SS type A sorting domain-containing protein [Bacteroidota bacterium]